MQPIRACQTSSQDHLQRAQMAQRRAMYCDIVWVQWTGTNPGGSPAAAPKPRSGKARTLRVNSEVGRSTDVRDIGLAQCPKPIEGLSMAVARCYPEAHCSAGGRGCRPRKGRERERIRGERRKRRPQRAPAPVQWKTVPPGTQDTVSGPGTGLIRNQRLKACVTSCNRTNPLNYSTLRRRPGAATR
ncbi:hypothetical protein WMY93_029805 [Mugilogobius chulae]|uniref:Uncharacterized protein n=1 Tax=Mugilogobius chulae TaxID=88201 RepID=A0AAW0MS97_9GOBI